MTDVRVTRRPADSAWLTARSSGPSAPGRLAGRRARAAGVPRALPGHRQGGTGGSGPAGRRKPARRSRCCRGRRSAAAPAVAVVRVGGQLLVVGVTEPRCAVLRELEVEPRAALDPTRPGRRPAGLAPARPGRRRSRAGWPAAAAPSGPPVVADLVAPRPGDRAAAGAAAAGGPRPLAGSVLARSRVGVRAPLTAAERLRPPPARRRRRLATGADHRAAVPPTRDRRAPAAVRATARATSRSTSTPAWASRARP